jgi:hypothetical protein
LEAQTLGKSKSLSSYLQLHAPPNAAKYGRASVKSPILQRSKLASITKSSEASKIEKRNASESHVATQPATEPTDLSLKVPIKIPLILETLRKNDVLQKWSALHVPKQPNFKLVRFLIGKQKVEFFLPEHAIENSRTLLHFQKVSSCFLEGESNTITFPTMNPKYFQYIGPYLLNPETSCDLIEPEFCLELAEMFLYLELSKPVAYCAQLAAQNIQYISDFGGTSPPLVKSILKCVDSVSLREVERLFCIEGAQELYLDEWWYWSERLVQVGNLDDFSHCVPWDLEKLKELIFSKTCHLLLENLLCNIDQNVRSLKLPSNPTDQHVVVLIDFAKKHKLLFELNLEHTVPQESLPDYVLASPMKVNAPEKSQPLLLKQSKPILRINRTSTNANSNFSQDSPANEVTLKSESLCGYDQSQLVKLIGNEVNWSTCSLRLTQSIPVVRLSISDCKLTAPQVDNLATWVESARCPLKELALIRCVCIQGMSRIVTALSNGSKLNVLSMEENIAQSLPGGRDFQLLNSFREISEAQRLKFTPKQPQLAISLSRNILPPSLTISLMDAVFSWPFLSKLNISKMQLGQHLEIDRLFSSFLPHLKELDISCNRLPNRCMERFIAAICGNNSILRGLEKLNVSENYFNEEWVNELSKTLPNIPHLRDLRMDYWSSNETEYIPPISLNVLDFFFERVVCAPALAFLSVRNFYFDSEEVQLLCRVVKSKSLTIVISPQKNSEQVKLKKAIKTSKFPTTIFGSSIWTNTRELPYPPMKRK